MRKKTILFLIFLSMIISQQLVAQNEDSVKCIQGSINAVQTINQVLFKLNDSNRVYYDYVIGMIDSICNSKKSAEDFTLENTILSDTREMKLGNDLIYKCHYIGNLEVKYVTFWHKFLVKVQFMYSFYFNGKKQIDESFHDFLRTRCNCPLIFTIGDYDVENFRAEYTSSGGLEMYKEIHPAINFDIPLENVPEKTSIMVNFVNDPSNQFTYGFACSIGGMPPRGYEIFANLFHFKHFGIMEKLLYSPNPVTRLYACDALEHAYKKNLYVLPLKISDRINEIKNEETKIECCWGCSYEIMSIKEAVKEAEIPKKYLYHNFTFPDDNEE